MRDDPGLFHALSDTISRATELVQLEFRVFKAELEEKATRVKAGIGLIVAGAVLVTAALFLLLQAAVLALVQGGMSPAGATLLVAAATIAAGAAFFVSGRKQLDGDALMPDRTIRGIERDSAVVKEKLT
jgi:hypothetical protein